jgi:hypothetical protein
MEYCYCVLVPAGGVGTEVSAGAVGIRSAFDPVAAESGFAGVLAFESFADLSLFKTSSTLLPPALMSSPIPCIVLHPAMNAMAAASATKLRFITISSALSEWSDLLCVGMADPSQSACRPFASSCFERFGSPRAARRTAAS